MARFSSSLNVFYTVILVCGLSYSIPATAQELLLDEIVVTAQKRKQNLQDTPVSVTAFSGDAMIRVAMANGTQIRTWPRVIV